jgi:hypothetical protein
MIRYERTFDYSLIREIMTHPKLYGWASDDTSPKREEFRPIQDSRIWYVLAYEGDALLGMFMYVPQSAVCWEVHCCLLPAAWGKHSRVALAHSFRWIWALTSCRRIVASIPAYNRLAVKLARLAGMTEYGRNAASFLKHGSLHDQICFGVSPSCLQ